MALGVGDESDHGAVVARKLVGVDVVSAVIPGRTAPEGSTALEGDDAIAADVPAGEGCLAMVTLKLSFPASDDAAEAVLILEACNARSEVSTRQWKVDELQASGEEKAQNKGNSARGHEATYRRCFC